MVLCICFAINTEFFTFLENSVIHINYINTYVCIYVYTLLCIYACIQSVLGGMCGTSGECSLC